VPRGLTRCEVCGWAFAGDIPSEVQIHNKNCQRFLAARVHYGTEYVMNFRDEAAAKERGWGLVLKEQTDLSNRVEGAEMIYRAWFSRSVGGMNNNYSLQHPSYQKYIAMMLHQEHQRRLFPPDVFEELIRKYGTLPGIKNGYSMWDSLGQIWLKGGEAIANEC
jgi:hypothetical protein